MNIKVLHNNIIHFTVDTQYELCSTFVRIQEFYESPFPNIRGKYFSLDAYMDTYASVNGEFSYFTDWGGFNFPSHIVDNFRIVFAQDLREKEYKILKEIEKLNISDKFYIIATYGKDNKSVTINHELAHALYYLNDDYFFECNEIYNKIPEKTKHKINKYFTEIGYAKEVFIDETQAYLSTDSRDDLQNYLTLNKETSNVVAAFRKNFKKFMANIA